MRRFVILREAGGIGDVVRTFPVARGLKEMHPGARVDYCCLAGYEGLVRLSPDVDRVFTVTERERRPRDATPDPARFPYLARVCGGHLRQGYGAQLPSVALAEEGAEPGVRLIDLYCPAYRHERETEGAVTLDRVEIFARAAAVRQAHDGRVLSVSKGAAGVEASTPRIVVPEGARRLARARLRRFLGRHVHHGDTEARRTAGMFGTAASDDAGWNGMSDVLHTTATMSFPYAMSPSVSPCLRGVRIGLAPYATHVSRSLPSRRQVIGLAQMLREAGAQLVFFHSWKCARPGRYEVRPVQIAAYPALRLPWPELAAFVALCDLVISVDTGVFHLAGALGVPTLGLFGPTSGEVMCRPYPTHSPVTSPERPPGCDPPCYGRPARGYSKDVCGRVGCEVMRALRPGGVCAEAGNALTATGR